MLPGGNHNSVNILVYKTVYGKPPLDYNVLMKPATHTPNVRISPRAHDLLRQMAVEEQQSMQSVLDRALEHYRREKFLRAANADYAALRIDHKGWKDELRERELWEQTLSDGLKKE
jgi:Regulator of G protein signalling-like domain